MVSAECIAMFFVIEKYRVGASKSADKGNREFGSFECLPTLKVTEKCCVELFSCKEKSKKHDEKNKYFTLFALKPDEKKTRKCNHHFELDAT